MVGSGPERAAHFGPKKTLTTTTKMTNSLIGGAKMVQMITNEQENLNNIISMAVNWAYDGSR